MLQEDEFISILVSYIYNLFNLNTSKYSILTCYAPKHDDVILEKETQIILTFKYPYYKLFIVSDYLKNILDMCVIKYRFEGESFIFTCPIWNKKKEIKDE